MTLPQAATAGALCAAPPLGHGHQPGADHDAAGYVQRGGRWRWRAQGAVEGGGGGRHRRRPREGSLGQGGARPAPAPGAEGKRSALIDRARARQTSWRDYNAADSAGRKMAKAVPAVCAGSLRHQASLAMPEWACPRCERTTSSGMHERAVLSFSLWQFLPVEGFSI